MIRAAPGRDDRVGQCEQRRVLGAEVVVELLRDVAGELEVLLLVLAHRHVRRLVQQHVGRLQHRMVNSATLAPSRFLPTCP
jgi:hypothetical protein